MTPSKTIKSLADYSLLGRSGLRVSPLCLGTMTFGTQWGFGVDAKGSRAVFDRYLDAGGNFIDTADGYTEGASETMLGEFISDAKVRDRVVLATKFSMTAQEGDPNCTGNGRKNMVRALDASLRRLKTDYVDLYWMHFWDALTPVEEVMQSLAALVAAGKVRYIGLSDTPAWYLARAQTFAELRGWPRVVALQLEYSLVERNIEREHIPAALELGMGVTPWSPLGGGLLTGKYRQGAAGPSGDGRLAAPGNGERWTDRNRKIVDAVVEIAKKLGKTPAQVALHWVATRPGVTSTIVGATKVAQLEENLAALEFDLPRDMSDTLEELGRPEVVFPYTFFTPQRRLDVTGARTATEPRWYRPRG